MKRSIYISLLLCNLTLAGSRIELNLGQSYDFAEKDILELIDEHINKNKANFEQKAREIHQKGAENVKNYKPKDLKALEPATEDRVFYPNLTYTLNEDIRGADGKIIYKKGYSFNPADYVKINYAMIVIDGTNKAEVEWFKTSGYANSIAYRLLLSNGSYYDLNQELKQAIFYLVPQIRDRFNIQKTPSIIKQVGNVIEVREICLSCKEQNTTLSKAHQ
ncbi:chromosome segregation protein ParM [Campylobacter sp. MIT 12-8780]|uniref:chromosome segregation protein ParM n=1 Tax=unclassified Campylobacter TaxID=2593542 RepID=UPI00115D2232|nr:MULTISPECIES: chromosome segregation protein ParM [unclassified Campylobacter]NDJ27704.1 chromosome segregation protein ParM [Campylobacter sp. MIT 19-121]TQR40867.1 chromosome segregation protein ParM [Campylobacter sp. MIT 12-8780]